MNAGVTDGLTFKICYSIDYFLKRVVLTKNKK